MAVILDTGVIYAYYDRSDDWHERSVALMNHEPGQFILPAPVIPEIDHLLGVRLGGRARLTFYDGLVDGSFFLADLPRDRYQRVLDLNREFDDLGLGFVDASIVAIAESIGLRRIATTDRRHFVPLSKKLNLELPLN